MAELPKYRPLGVGIPSVPTVDFVATGAAKARAIDAVTKGLNSMTDYLYKKQVQITKREAAQYAFENPVSAEQIQDAISQGRDIEEIVGDPDTVFGAVTTATAAQQLTTELQIEASKKISSYSAMIKAGQDIDIQSMRNDLTAMIDGHSELIAGIDPAQGLKYSAAVNATASTAYKSALENKLKIAQTKSIVKIDGLIKELPNRLKEIIGAKDVDVEIALGTAAILIDEAKNAAINTGKFEYATKTAEDLNGMVTKAKIGVLLDHAKKPGNERAALRGNFGERNNALFATLNDEEKALLRKTYLDEQKELMSFADAQDRRADAKIKNGIETLTPQITEAIRNRKFDVATPLIKELEKLDADKAEKYFNVIITDGGIDVAERIVDLNSKSMRRELTEDDILDAYNDREITSGTMDRLLGELQAQRDKRFKRAEELLSDHYGKPEILARGKTGKPPENLRAFADKRSEMIIKLEDDPSFDPIAYAKSVIKEETANPLNNPATKKKIDDLNAAINSNSKSMFGRVILDKEDLLVKARELQANPKEGGLFSSGTNMEALSELLEQLEELKTLQGSD